mmetsp:Transcript_31984/g.44598  ORF Transcript_31984/g.44598 Transcript_31984/m.44598 type:complete len:89 (+) Transcript_31984:496-762(+)
MVTYISSAQWSFMTAEWGGDTTCAMFDSHLLKREISGCGSRIGTLGPFQRRRWKLLSPTFSSIRWKRAVMATPHKGHSLRCICMVDKR